LELKLLVPARVPPLVCITYKIQRTRFVHSALHKYSGSWIDEVSGMELRIQNRELLGSLRTSGSAALALLAPVLHDHIRV
jgi:hypothetical protein